VAQSQGTKAVSYVSRLRKRYGYMMGDINVIIFISQSPVKNTGGFLFRIALPCLALPCLALPCSSKYVFVCDGKT